MSWVFTVLIMFGYVVCAFVMNCVMHYIYVTGNVSTGGSPRLSHYQDEMKFMASVMWPVALMLIPTILVAGVFVTIWNAVTRAFERRIDAFVARKDN